jgi:hypothetical protein
MNDGIGFHRDRHAVQGRRDLIPKESYDPRHGLLSGPLSAKPTAASSFGFTVSMRSRCSRITDMHDVSRA